MTTPKPTDAKIAEVLTEARRGLSALYLEIHESIARDVNERVEAAFAALASRASPSGRGEGEAVQKARRALSALYLEVPESVARSVSEHVEAAFSALAPAPGSGERPDSRTRATIAGAVLHAARLLLGESELERIASDAVKREEDATLALAVAVRGVGSGERVRAKALEAAAESLARHGRHPDRETWSEAAKWLRAIASSGPYLAAWYEPDGSVSMLPAEEVTRRRKAAAKVIGAARLWRNKRAIVVGLSPCAGSTAYYSASVAVLDAEAPLIAALDALDASPSSIDGGQP